MTYERYIAHVGRQITVTLERDGARPTAPTRELTLWGEEPLILERDTRSPLDPLWPMRCELHVMSETHYMLEPLLHDDREWTIKVLDSTNTLFAGRLERGLYEEEYDRLPYGVTLTAVCGLKTLEDYYLPIRSLPRAAESQLTSLYEVVKTCLKRTGVSEIETLGDAATLLTAAYINADGYRTDEDGMRSSQKASDVLEGILQSLGLVVYQVRGKWRIHSTAHRWTGATMLETETHPLYEIPSLEAESRYGSVRINLPSDELDTLYPLEPVTLPIKGCSNHKGNYFAQTFVNPLELCATYGINSQATRPSLAQQSKGMQLILPYVYDEGIVVSYPYEPPKGAKGFTVSVKLGFPSDTLPEGLPDDVEILSVAEITLVDNPHRSSELVSTLQAPAYKMAINDPKNCPVVAGVAEEERQRKSGYILWYDFDDREGKAKDGMATFTSPLAAKLSKESSTPEKFTAEVRKKLPYDRVKIKEVVGSEALGTYSFTTLLPFPQTLEVHKYRKTIKSYNLTHIAVHIPLRFFACRDDQYTEYHPKAVAVGSIGISYNYRDEDKKDSFLIADRGRDYVREGEPCDLTYTTLIEGCKLSPQLKGLVRSKEGTPLAALGGTTIPERVAANYFALMGEHHDTITLSTDATTPFATDKVYSLRNRQGHRYHLAGERWDAYHQRSELTLTTAPTTLDTTSYER